MEHLRHFQLSEDPFRSDPLERFDVSLDSQRDALARLERGALQGKGLMLLVGGSGAGKTRVARWLFDALEEELFESGMLVVLRPQAGADWLLPRLARQLGVDSPSDERDALIPQIHERLAIIHEDGRRAALIVDGGDALADPATLLELAGLLKLEYEDRRLMTVLLVGGVALDEVFTSVPALAHGVDVRVALEGLSREESDNYLHARIRAAGGKPEILLPGAAAALHELSEGAPGRLNILADNALCEAWRAQRSELTRADVERAQRALAWDRLGPAPAEPAAVELTQIAPTADTTLIAEAPGPLGDTQSAAMDFDAEPAAAAPRELDATRVEAVASLEPEPPPKNENDVDDLFMELLDE